MCLAADAASIPAPFSSDYTLVSLAGPSGVTAPYGGIAFLDDNTLLIGGSANNAAGVIDEVPVTRDGQGNINGFGAATLFSTAPNIDGGLAFGPGGDLFYTAYPTNDLGEIKPGSTSPDDVVSLDWFGCRELRRYACFYAWWIQWRREFGDRFLQRRYILCNVADSRWLRDR